MSSGRSQANERQVTSARIDVPFSTVHAYLFVDREKKTYTEWWAALFVHLQELAEKPFEWRFEPIQEKYVCRPKLSAASREDLARFLKTAPAELVAGHKTLRMAVELPVEKVERLAIMFFSTSAQ